MLNIFTAFDFFSTLKNLTEINRYTKGYTFKLKYFFIWGEVGAANILIKITTFRLFHFTSSWRIVSSLRTIIYEPSSTISFHTDPFFGPYLTKLRNFKCRGLERVGITRHHVFVHTLHN